MKMAIRNPNDLAMGILLLAIGVTGVLLCASLPTGSALRMGPGFVPMAAATALVCFGACIVFRGMTVSGPVLEGWAWRPLILVLASVGMFLGGMASLGLVAAIAATVLTAAAASRETRWGPAMALAIGLSAGCAGLFVGALGLPFTLWPSLR